jgi:hypothetical protein
VYAQHAIKSFPPMLSIGMLYFLKSTRKYQIKMQILTINNRIFQNRLGTHPIGPSQDFEEKKFWIAHQKNLVSRLLNHRGNVRTMKSKEKKPNSQHIRI